MRSGIQKFIFKSNNALTPTLSTCFVLGILVSTAGGILSIGLPYIDDIKDNSEDINILDQFNDLIDDLKKMTEFGQGDSKTFNLNIGDGSIQLKNSDFDRTIITYSLVDNFDFDVREMHDPDNLFKIDMKTGLSITDVKIWRFINGEQELLEHDSTNMYPIYEITLLRDNEYFEGTMQINLLNGNTVLGKIWLFDSNSIVYTTNDKNRNIILEKAGILYKDSTNTVLKRSTIVNTQEDSNFISISISQTNIVQECLIPGNENKIIKLHLKNKLNMKLDGNTSVHNIRIHFLNSNAAEWKEELLNKNSNEYSEYSSFDSHTLEYIPPNPEDVHLVLMLSVFDINIL